MLVLKMLVRQNVSLANLFKLGVPLQGECVQGKTVQGEIELRARSLSNLYGSRHQEADIIDVAAPMVWLSASPGGQQYSLQQAHDQAGECRGHPCPYSNAKKLQNRLPLKVA